MTLWEVETSLGLDVNWLSFGPAVYKLCDPEQVAHNIFDPQLSILENWEFEHFPKLIPERRMNMVSLTLIAAKDVIDWAVKLQWGQEMREWVFGVGLKRCELAHILLISDCSPPKSWCPCQAGFFQILKPTEPSLDLHLCSSECSCHGTPCCWFLQSFTSAWMCPP